MSCHCHGKCSLAKIAWVLVVIGGLNWGVVGVGRFLGNSDLNLVSMLVGSWSKTAEAIVYILVGICAFVAIFGCPCKKCKDVNANCADCKVAAPTQAPQQ